MTTPTISHRNLITASLGNLQIINDVDSLGLCFDDAHNEMFVRVTKHYNHADESARAYMRSSQQYKAVESKELSLPY